jgi:hypothetical protein
LDRILSLDELSLAKGDTIPLLQINKEEERKNACGIYKSKILSKCQIDFLQIYRKFVTIRLFVFQVSIASSFSWRDGICRFLMTLAKKNRFLAKANLHSLL